MTPLNILLAPDGLRTLLIGHSAVRTDKAPGSLADLYHGFGTIADKARLMLADAIAHGVLTPALADSIKQQALLAFNHYFVEPNCPLIPDAVELVLDAELSTSMENLLNYLISGAVLKIPVTAVSGSLYIGTDGKGYPSEEAARLAGAVAPPVAEGYVPNPTSSPSESGGSPDAPPSAP